MHFTKKIVLVTVAWGCLIPATIGLTAEADKYLPDNATSILTVNVRQILDSKLSRKYVLESLKAAMKRSDEFQKGMHLLGLNPLKDIDRIILAGSDVVKNNTPLGLNDNSVAVVYGKFDEAKFQSGIKEAAKKFNFTLKIHDELGTKFYELSDPKDKDKDKNPETMCVILLDNKTLIAGNKNMMKEVCARHAGKKQVALKKEMKALLEKTDVKQSVWAASLVSAKDLKEGIDQLVQAGLIDDKTKEAIGKITAVTVGLHVTDQIKFSVAATTETKEAAIELKNATSKLLDMAIQSLKPFFEPIEEILKSFQTEAKGNNAIISGQIDSKHIEKIVEQFSPKEE